MPLHYIVAQRLRTPVGLFRWQCLLWLVGLWLCVEPVLAQPLDPSKHLTQYLLDGWTQTDGLPQNSIVGLVQTPDGYLWMSTFQGLARFDGVKMVNFNANNTPELGVNPLRPLHLGRDSTLWVGTIGAGLVAYRNGVFRRYDQADGLAHHTIWSLYEDRRGRLWIGTDRGLSVRAGGKLYNVTTMTGTEGKTVVGIAEDSLGQIWLGTRDGLFSFDGQLVPGTTPDQRGLKIWPEVGPNVEAFARQPNGRFWVGSERGLFYLKSNSWVLDQRPGAPVGIQVKELYVDRQGQLWAGTLTNGLYRLGKLGYEHLNRTNDLRDNQVESILEDQEGGLWFGTYVGGVHRLKESKFTSYGQREGMMGESAYCVLETPSDGIFVGTNNGGVTQWVNGRAVAHIGKAQGLSDNYVRTLYRNPAGELWIGFYGKGINVLRPDGSIRQIDTRNGLSDNFVRILYPGAQGALWIGTRNGLNYHPPSGGKLVQLGREAGFQVTSIISLCTGPEGRLWVGTEGGGVYRAAATNPFAFEPLPGTEAEVVLALRYDPDRNGVWVGTSTSLLWISAAGELTRFSARYAAPGTFPNGITQLHLDPSGTLWMGSNDGVYRIELAQLDAFKAGRVAQLTGRPYGVRDGMRSASCLPGGYPNLVQLRDGALWFPTATGIASISPARVPRNTVPPPVVVELFKRDSLVVAATSPNPSFSPSRTPLEIHYATLSFTAPEFVTAKYRLSGFDLDWIPAGNRRVAYYTNLPPGKYRFEVLAANNDGVWSESPAAVDLVILTPWYQRWWAYGIFLLGMGGLVYLAIQVRYRQLEHEKHRLEEIVGERTQELQYQKAELQSAYEEIKQQILQVELANRDLEHAYNDIERQAKNVNDSMEYARRIQEAILPNLAVLQTSLPKSFVYYAPRDIVSGDFYWFVRKAEAFYLAVVDCTGHGVPGAFMSVMGNALLNQLVNERKLRQPADILYHLNTAVQNNLHQYDPNSTSLDGMEIALCAVNPLGMHLTFAAANQTLYRFRGNEFDEFRGDRYPIGGGQYGIRTFTAHEIDIELGDTFYLFSDGAADQFGGPRGRKFGYHRLQSLFGQIQILSMREQQAQIEHTLNTWRGDQRQVDDILIIGFRF